MKTATVTWITYNNYGTLLQAYALQKKIKEYGCDNKILYDGAILKEYRKKKGDNDKTLELRVEGTCNTSLVKRIIQLIQHPRRVYGVLIARVNRNRYIRPYEESQYMCEVFKKRELDIFEEVTPQSLSEINDLFDLFISGSDQIWSVSEDIFNPYYYLDFVTKKKISYAPSLGIRQIPESIVNQIKDLLERFEVISVREEKSAHQLSELTGKKISWVADPTLLYNREFWTCFTSDISVFKKRYLLCYFLENKEWYFKFARRIAKKLHLKIILVPNRWEYISNEHVCRHGVGPKEFVSLIQHADYVLTDSYHGSIFSIIFNKEFLYLLRFHDKDPKSQNIRIEALLGYLDLYDRIVKRENDEVEDGFIDYEKVNKKVIELRKKSLEYLHNSLNTETVNFTYI